MKRFAPVAFALLVTCSPEPQESGSASRGVRPAGKKAAVTRKFNPAQSAALFVGVKEFAAAPSGSGVKYTVDDAVDLAYTFALERHLRLVAPQRVVLALTGEPEKSDSRERLQKLRNAGAVVTGATRAEILAHLNAQSQRTGKEGLLILSFASHGFTHEGTPYILTSTSRFGEPASSLSAVMVNDIASRVERSLVFIDACRERVARGKSTSSGTPLLADFMKNVVGHVVFYAAAPGNYAFEDDRRRNGVFTRAVIDGLRNCDARTVEGLVTVDTLSRLVEDRVRAWIEKNRGPVLKATQVSMDADTKTMPLASCVRPPSPVKVSRKSGTVTAFALNGAELWRREMDAQEIKIDDVDDDGTSEVLAINGSTITAIDALGEQLWSVDTTMPVTSVRIEHLFSKARKSQVIAVSSDERTSAISLIDYDGVLLAAYSYSGKVHDYAIDQITARHKKKMIVSASGGRVFMIDLVKDGPSPRPLRVSLGKGAEQWWGSVMSSVLTKLTVIDHDNDGKREIALKTPKGRVYITFDGKILARYGEQFQLFASPQ